jgi:uncharacterized protein (TIGR02246 family)
MTAATGRPPEEEARILYRQLVNSWNSRDATGFATLFTEDGEAIGFDGTQMAGREEIAATLRHIFIDHPTPLYVGIVRTVRAPHPGVALLRAAAGMIPPGGADIDPALNAVQGLVAVATAAGWRIAAFQNTPAQFHGRLDLGDALTMELREEVRKNPPTALPAS